MLVEELEEEMSGEQMVAEKKSHAGAARIYFDTLEPFSSYAEGHTSNVYCA